MRNAGRTNPDRVFYLAVRDEVYADIFDEPIAKILVEDYKVHIVLFQLEQEVIFKWIPWSNTGS
ncbi:element excision factor XisH family protein [Nostoc sp.]|uniref:element excision factor XisH family protein n=1 Tax=Nostoc sp. TaxID=1180 RepID=UPI003FA54C58